MFNGKIINLKKEFYATMIYVTWEDKKYVNNENVTMEVIEKIYIHIGCTVDPKNPIIAAFFKNIGYADQLGSGVRNFI